MADGSNINHRSSFPYFSPSSIREISADIEESLRNGSLTLGPRTIELEKRFSEYSKLKYSVAVSSGAASLEIPLRYFGVKGREVIVPTNTFVATPNSVVFAGGRPVFADVREETLCIDPDDVKRRITPKTAGIIVVHIAGLVCPQIYELRDLCEDHGLFMLEDCAHAHGAMIDDKMAGTLGDVGCFSFAPTKNMTVGEGGLLATNNEELAEKARYMRNRGLNPERLMIMLGHSWCMSEISAILGIHQLENLDYFVCQRNEIARHYERSLAKVDGVSLFKTPPNIRHGYHKFPVRLGEGFSVEKIAKVLKEKYGVETGTVYYPPCHLHPYYRETLGTGEGDFPVSEKVLKQVLTLPMHLAITEDEIELVSNMLSQAMQDPNKVSDKSTRE
jgi:dTDP-4-amino-4,6-dideoxygalactose transaminase